MRSLGKQLTIRHASLKKLRMKAKMMLKMTLKAKKNLLRLVRLRELRMKMT